jgi:hypothetical protein
MRRARVAIPARDIASGSSERCAGKRRGFFDLFSEDNSSRFPMDVGHKYLVFVMKRDDAFFVSNCGNSGELDERMETVRALARRDR